MGISRADHGVPGQDNGFKAELAEFFWTIAANSEQCEEELLEKCTTKFADMIKYWSLE